ncbi:MAG: glycoside hydrolase family 25 protein, partial [Thermomicrobiales bacterium]
MLTIADISDNNGAIDFAAASAAVDGYMVKATQFTNYTNLRYAEQLSGARQYGKANGQYHYAQPQRGEPIPQAQWFLAQMDWRAGELPALDLEEGDGDLTDWALAWLVFVESVLHIPPAIYTFPDFAKNHLTPNPKLARYPLWWASWNTVPAPVPAPWHTYTLWQY